MHAHTVRPDCRWRIWTLWTALGSCRYICRARRLGAGFRSSGLQRTPEPTAARILTSGKLAIVLCTRLQGGGNAGDEYILQGSPRLTIVACSGPRGEGVIPQSYLEDSRSLHGGSAVRQGCRGPVDATQ
ncbi:hypothetical protein C8T65DRAFT_670449 [Cerioporus squamosus]|nr:hypothetical protein C8T65DRAFT_670449 [Cerioporus squamosus]